MDIEELRAQIEGLFNSTLDDDGNHRIGDLSHPKLEEKHGLDLTYLKSVSFEGSSIRSDLRHCPTDELGIKPLIQNWTVPTNLLEGGLRLFGDSILAYHDLEESAGELRYYPSVILTFWAGFETFVRQSCEVMLLTVPHVPEPVVHFLREKERYVHENGLIKTKRRYRPVLERYFLLLRYGCGYEVNRSCTHWQGLKEAQRLRDYYTHLDINEPRSISANDVAVFMEQVMLGIIWPSTEIKRTLLVGIHRLYWIWDALGKLIRPFSERPIFKDWILNGPRMIYAPFKGVDSDRFPSIER